MGLQAAGGYGKGGQPHVLPGKKIAVRLLLPGFLGSVVELEPPFLARSREKRGVYSSGSSSDPMFKEEKQTKLFTVSVSDPHKFSCGSGSLKCPYGFGSRPLIF